MIDNNTMVLIFCIATFVAQIGFLIFIYFSLIAYSKDQVEAMRKLLELLQKEFQSNQEQHKELLESFNTNDQKLFDNLVDTKKNMFNLAVFLGYRPRNLEDI